MDQILAAQKGAGRVDSTEMPEPIRTKPMSFAEASRRVKEFELRQREATIEQAPAEDSNAGQVESAIQVDASDSPRGDTKGRGYAV
jgi:hypothetical protein